jgi:hypothetical protein
MGRATPASPVITATQNTFVLNFYTDSNIAMQRYALNVNIVPQDVHKRPAYKDNFEEVYTIRLCKGPL